MNRLTIVLLFLALQAVPLPVSAQGVDYNILCALQQNRFEPMNDIMTVVSNSLILTPVVPVAMFGAGLAADNRDLVHSGVDCGLSLLLTASITEALKNSVRRPRPYLGYPDDLLPLKTVRGFSFPSGHTSLTFATAASLCLSYPRWYVIVPAALWASGVGFSRLYMGVHYPSDVLVGALVGVGSSLVAHWLVDRLRDSNSPVPTPKAFVVPLSVRF